MGSVCALGSHVTLSLARLATLQGYPVSHREFELLTQNLDSQALNGVPLAGKIGALWHTRFPQSDVRAPAWPPSPGDLPALWLGPLQADGSTTVLTVLGALTNGALTSIDEQGASVVLHPEQAYHGRLLWLKPSVAAGETGLEPPPAPSETAGTEVTALEAAAGRLLNWILRLLRIG